MKHRQKAEKEPSKYISLIIDRMDQAKTNIPHIISNPKVKLQLRKVFLEMYLLLKYVSWKILHCMFQGV